MFCTVRSFRSRSEIEKYLVTKGNTEAGSRILSMKGVCFSIELDGIDTRAANILKQDAISVGADCAVPRIASSFEKGVCSVLLIGNLRSVVRLLDKIRLQPFGLPDVAEEIEKAIKNYMKDKFFISFRGRSLQLDKPVIMGILNVTPDSFSDGGLYCDKEAAVRRACQMVEEGASIIDIGGESTRPGAFPVSVDEEIRRVVPVVEEVRKRVEDSVFISVDTYKSQVAKLSLDAGADMINDISGMQFDVKMLDVVVNYGCPVVIMHIKGTPRDMQVNPHYDDVIKEIMQYFNTAVDRAVSAGVDRSKVIIDPGIGFGKRVEDNLCILRRLDEFKTLGLPILVGTSRKSFIGIVCGDKLPTDRLEGSLITAYVSMVKGAKIVRVHDVKETRKVLDMFKSIEGVEC